MYKKLLWMLLAFIPAFASAEQYDFSKFGEKRAHHSHKPLFKLPSRYYMQVFLDISPDRLLMQAFDQPEETSQKSSKKNRKDKKQSITPEHPDFKRPMRHQKGLIGWSGGYYLDRNSAVEFTIPSSLLPANVMPSITYQRMFPRFIQPFHVYVKAGLVMPLAYYSDQELAADSEADDGASIRTGTTSRTKRSGGSSNRTHRTASSQGLSSLLSFGSKTRDKKAEKKHDSASQHSSSTKPKKPQKPSRRHRHSSENASSVPSEDASTSFKWDMGLMVKAGALYPLSPNWFIEGSGNLIIPFTGAPPGASLPFGSTFWISVGIQYKLG